MADQSDQRSIISNQMILHDSSMRLLAPERIISYPAFFLLSVFTAGIHMVIYFAELHSQTHYIDILLQTSMLLP